jgi:hypothetical protein
MLPHSTSLSLGGLSVSWRHPGNGLTRQQRVETTDAEAQRGENDARRMQGRPGPRDNFGISVVSEAAPRSRSDSSLTRGVSSPLTF